MGVRAHRQAGGACVYLTGDISSPAKSKPRKINLLKLWHVTAWEHWFKTEDSGFCYHHLGATFPENCYYRPDTCQLVLYIAEMLMKPCCVANLFFVFHQKIITLLTSHTLNYYTLEESLIEGDTSLKHEYLFQPLWDVWISLVLSSYYLLFIFSRIQFECFLFSPHLVLLCVFSFKILHRSSCKYSDS